MKHSLKNYKVMEIFRFQIGKKVKAGAVQGMSSQSD